MKPAPGASPRVLLLDPWCLVPYYSAALARGLERRGTEVTLGSIRYDLDPDCFDRYGIANDPGFVDLFANRRIASPFLRRTGKLLQGCLNLLAFSARLLISRTEVVHMQQTTLLQRGIPFELWFLRLARRLGTKLVYTVHNLVPHDSGDRYRAVFQRLYGEMDALICHSPEIRDRLIAEFCTDPEKIRVIPHGPLFESATQPSTAAARIALGLPADLRVILWQGFIRPYKGLDFLLDAWASLEPAKSARLIIAGSGAPAELQGLRDRASRLGLLDSVEFRFRFLDARELVNLYAAADAVVYPYREITTSGALMTGVAAGQALIATDLAPFRGLLRHRENALLVPFGDCQALVDAVTEVCSSHSLRATLRRNVAALNESCSWDSIADRTRECYDTIAGQRKNGVRLALGRVPGV